MPSMAANAPGPVLCLPVSTPPPTGPESPETAGSGRQDVRVVSYGVPYETVVTGTLSNVRRNQHECPNQEAEVPQRHHLQTKCSKVCVV